MKQSTYAQKLNEALDDREKLTRALQALTLVSLHTYEAKHIWRELTEAVDKLDKTIERYQRLATIEAKHDAESGAQ